MLQLLADLTDRIVAFLHTRSAVAPASHGVCVRAAPASSRYEHEGIMRASDERDGVSWTFMAVTVDSR